MEEVCELQPVPNAYVPVMKFKICGISVDLLYASICLLVVPEVSWTRSCFCTYFLYLPNHSKLTKDMPFCLLFFPSLCNWMFLASFVLLCWPDDPKLWVFSIFFSFLFFNKWFLSTILIFWRYFITFTKLAALEKKISRVVVVCMEEYFLKSFYGAFNNSQESRPNKEIFFLHIFISKPLSLDNNHFDLFLCVYTSILNLDSDCDINKNFNVKE